MGWKGHPHGLKEKKSLACRTPVKRCLDAMTNDRVYRKSISIEEAIQELRKCGNQFDPKIKTFVRIIEKQEDLMRQQIRYCGAVIQGNYNF